MPSNLLFLNHIASTMYYLVIKCRSVVWTTACSPSPAPAPEATASPAPAYICASVHGWRNAITSEFVVHKYVDVRVELGLVLHHVDALDWDARPLQELDDGCLGFAYLSLVAEILCVDIDLDILIFLATNIKEVHLGG